MNCPRRVLLPMLLFAAHLAAGSCTCQDRRIGGEPWTFDEGGETDAIAGADTLLPATDAVADADSRLPATDAVADSDVAADSDAMPRVDAQSCGLEVGPCGCLDECREGVCRSAFARTWKGRYTCTQGLTGLTLTVTGPSDDLRATFEFYAIPENPDLPRGLFSMSGEMDCQGNIRLRPDQWIDRPNGRWDLVGLDGQFRPAGPTMSGRVLGGHQCERFELEPVR